MLNFKNIDFKLKQTINKYYFLYGEGSCQHSFAANFCLRHKYDDVFCEKDGVLYIGRNGLSDDKYIVYLFPMCDRNNKILIKNAINELINDAEQFGKKVKFITITKRCKDILAELFSNEFEVIDCRENYEYIFKTEKIANLSGSAFQSKRNLIHKLEKEYEGGIVSKRIDNDDIEKIKYFYENWVDEKEHGVIELFENEKKEFSIAIDNYEKLELEGIVIYINGEIAGFNFGSIINDTTYDGMIQKGNVSFNGIYELLNRETAKLILNKCEYMNFEEDLGIEGLRSAKMHYQPDVLLEKYIAKEANY